MNDRIILLMKVKNLSAAEIADEIGVQRSAVSHLLSGRNNPSLGFMQKILEHYPDVRAEWLIMGHGSMFVSSEEPITKPTEKKSAFDELSLFDNSIVDEQVPPTILPDNEIVDSEVVKIDDAVSYNTQSKPTEVFEGHSIVDNSLVKTERIVIFMSDGTYKAYRPAKNSLE